MPLEAARVVAASLDRGLTDSSATTITLTRDEAILAVGILEAVIESLERQRPH